MRTIAIEEHIGTPKIEVAAKATGKILSRRTPAGLTEKLSDVGTGRLADMDDAGIDMQVLSATGTGLDKLDRVTGAALARESNDMLAEVVRAHPDRFAAFALLVMQDPEQAAAELERCVTKLGFKGAMINGTINNQLTGDRRPFGPGREFQEEIAGIKADKALAVKLDAIFKKYTAIR